MSKAVFTVRVNPSYDDLPEVRYHFPKRYLNTVKSVVDDWILYYEPERTGNQQNSRGGRKSYFATAKLNSIKKDSQRENHFYAHVSHYLEFDRAVPFREENGVYYESRLKRPDGNINKGLSGWAVRNIPDDEYNKILLSGFSQEMALPTHSSNRALSDEFDWADRPIVQQIVNRPFRDRKFSMQVKKAYGESCAFTGIKIVNGGGRSEVQAAHIRPVKLSGPDSVRNGIALCSTLHWMFDRGFVSIDSDYSLLMCKDDIPEPIMSMLNPDHQLRLPNSYNFRPHEQFLKYHRNNIFKG